MDTRCFVPQRVVFLSTFLSDVAIFMSSGWPLALPLISAFGGRVEHSKFGRGAVEREAVDAG